MIMIMSPLNKKHAKGDQHSNDRRPVETGETQGPQTGETQPSGSQPEATEPQEPKTQEVEMSVTVPVDELRRRIREHRQCRRYEPIREPPSGSTSPRRER